MSPTPKPVSGSIHLVQFSIKQKCEGKSRATNKKETKIISVFTGLTFRDKQPFTLTPTGNLESPIDLHTQKRLDSDSNLGLSCCEATVLRHNATPSHTKEYQIQSFPGKISRGLIKKSR